MKNKTLKYLGFALIAILAFGCQNLDEPGFSDFPYDGPVLTLLTPSVNGATVIRSNEAVAPVTIKFKVEDDLGIANITVNLDDIEILNMNEFTDSRLVIIDDLTKDVANGTHSLTIIATDINNVVVTKTTTFEKVETPPYEPLFSGEKFYMPFDGDFSELISGISAAEVGTPGFTSTAKVGTSAYAGATDAYLTFPTAGLNLSTELSASFWYKPNSNDPAAGILVMGPEDTANPATAQNNRKSGFRFFRDNTNGKLRFKLNVGNGTADTWVDGGSAADVAPNSDWVHLAFTISNTAATVYINGQVVATNAFTGINWAGCDVLSIMSGSPRFNGWGHKSDINSMDELRLFDKVLSQNEINTLVSQGSQVFNMNFNGSYFETVSKTDAIVVGTPSFTTDSKEGSNAYTGATDSYLTFSTAGLLGDEFSATFWYNLNASPDRAGILTIGAEDTANPNSQNNRKYGFRLFREGGNEQNIKLNIGNGTSEATASVPSSFNLTNSSGWVHIAVTISQTKSVIYMDGVLAKETTLTGIDWTGCDIVSIMSGAPRFTGWSHKSDLSAMDALSLYNKVLSQQEIQALIN